MVGAVGIILAPPPPTHVSLVEFVGSLLCSEGFFRVPLLLAYAYAIRFLPLLKNQQRVRSQEPVSISFKASPKA